MKSIELYRVCNLQILSHIIYNYQVHYLFLENSKRTEWDLLKVVTTLSI